MINVPTTLEALYCRISTVESTFSNDFSPNISRSTLMYEIILKSKSLCIC